MRTSGLFFNRSRVPGFQKCYASTALTNKLIYKFKSDQVSKIISINFVGAGCITSLGKT